MTLTPIISTLFLDLSFSAVTLMFESTRIEHPLLCVFLDFIPSVAATVRYVLASLSFSSSSLVLKHSCSKIALGLLPRFWVIVSINASSWSFDVFSPPQLKDITVKSGSNCSHLDNRPAICHLFDGHCCRLSHSGYAPFFDGKAISLLCKPSTLYLASWNSATIGSA